MPDELVVSIKGLRRYLWRAVDQRGITLGMLVTARRDTSTTMSAPRVIDGSTAFVAVRSGEFACVGDRIALAKFTSARGW